MLSEDHDKTRKKWTCHVCHTRAFCRLLLPAVSLRKLTINWRGMPSVLLIGMRANTVKSRCNEPLYNEVLGIKNYLLYLSNSKIYEKEPRYNETSLSRTQFASPLALHYIEVPLCGTVIPGSTSGERIMRSMFATLSHIY